MKPFVMQLATAALLVAPFSLLAQNHLRPADQLGNLTLLTGPHLLSPAVGAASFTGTTSLHAGAFSFRRLSGPAPAARGVLTLGRSAIPFQTVVPLVPSRYQPVDPASLKFDTALPKTETRALQRTPGVPPVQPR